MDRKNSERVQAVTDAIIDDESHWVMENPSGQLWITALTYSRRMVERNGMRLARRSGPMQSRAVRPATDEEVACKTIKSTP